MVQGDGTNGFKKGEYGITVDTDYKSDSGNFQTLQKLANDHSATAALDVLKGDDKFDVKVQVTLDPNAAPVSMSTTPNESGGFTGFTLYPQPGRAPGLRRLVVARDARQAPLGPTSQPWTTDAYTHVVVNADRGWIPSTIYHELRHVLAGDFGRVAPYGAHHTGNVDRSTEEAEKEAVKNQVDVIRKQQ